MRILQFTDTHLFGNVAGRLRGVETDSSLRNVIEDAYARVPDYAAVLVTGDLVQDDNSGYLRFRSIFGNSPKPVLCIPGNHDDLVAMRHELNAPPFQICGDHSIEDWQFIMLDSYYPGHVGGTLSCDELNRLDRTLRDSPAHALVCLHHHPVTIGSQWLNNIGLSNTADFWRVIDAHRHVRAIVWGHVHQPYDAYRGAVRLLGTPSTGAQFLPHSQGFSIDTRPPAYRHFELHRNGKIDTDIQWVYSLAASRFAAL